jgi:hypothetical protein
MDEDSHIMSSNKSHDDSKFNSFSSSLDNDGENHREKHILCHCNTNQHRNEVCITTAGIPSFNLNNPSDLAHVVVQMVSKETNRTATESINRSFYQPNNTDKNLQYINPTNSTEIFRIRSIPETHPIMNNLNDLHPHADKGRIGSYTKLCDFTLLFMILQVELRLNKGSLVRPRLVDQVKARATIMTICEH